MRAGKQSFVPPGIVCRELLPTTCAMGCEKCRLLLRHRAPAAKAGPIFQRVTVCLKAYPDTNREFFPKLLRRGLHSYAASRLESDGFTPRPEINRRVYNSVCMRISFPECFLAATVSVLLPLAALGASPAGGSRGPLLVNGNSHIVVMEYEAWFGPKAVTFQSSVAMPLLQSKDMKPVGGGYDSADPAVIKQHVAWMEYMGIDAATSEVTNNVSCIFNSEWFVKKYVKNCTPSFRLANQIIRDNTGNLYPAWTMLGTRLGLIPLLGGIDENVLFKDIDGKTAFEKEAEYFAGLLQKYPERAVIYEGKPLMVIYLGAAQDPNREDHPLWYKLRQFLKKHPESEFEVHVQDDGGISRQPTRAVGYARQARRSDKNQSGIWVLELGRPAQYFLYGSVLSILSFVQRGWLPS